jgi:diguanylate cyclase (GGDEF)-like protein
VSITPPPKQPENTAQANQSISSRQGLSIRSLLVLSFVLISLLPISILGFKVYDAAWESAWREVQEKHLSLAKNLAAPLRRYIDDRHLALSLLAKKLQQGRSAANISKYSTSILEQGLIDLNRFKAVFLLDNNRKLINYASSYYVDTKKLSHFKRGDNQFLDTAFHRNKPFLSPVLINPYTAKTSLFIAQEIQLSAASAPLLLVGELKKSIIEEMRASIHFGKQGHSAMVDALGQVIAHPNPNWMNDKIKNISHLSVVKAMMTGNTGVIEFYSPFKKTEMVAGYTAVPHYGWGIMVPQPKSEVEAQVLQILRGELLWALAGIFIAAVLGLFLANWITRPIHILAKAGRNLQDNDYHYRLPDSHKFAPYEIQQLGHAFGGAVKCLINSRHALDKLSRSLQQQVNEATAELRSSNAKLEALTITDHLTQLSNRRHFEDTMTGLASRRQNDGESICLLLIDVDQFKNTNDQYGHPAGDAVLIQIGKLLKQSLRDSDVAARYAGDEFVILLRTDIDTARQRANQLRKAIDEHHFSYQQNTLHTTVSIGLTSCNIHNECNDIAEVLRRADTAMYDAKRLGRNRIAETAPQTPPQP